MRQRDEQHLKFIRSLPCIRCGNGIETEAAHYRSSDERIGKFNPGGRKPFDFFVLPLCGNCHRNGPDAQHTVGEEVFWEGCDPVLWALYLNAISGNYQGAEDFVQRQAALWLQRRSLICC